MSHVTYDEIWLKTQDYLNETIQLEPTQADRREHRKLLATLYYRYIQVANKLAECVDQVVQPQKKMLIRKLLEASLGRILELKADLVEADLCEWTHCGDVMEELNLTTLQSELKIPTCFRNERKDELEYRRNVIDNVLSKLGFLEKVEEKIKMSEQQAILIIQVHERARQGRLRAQFMKEIKSMKERSKPMDDDSEGKEGKISLPAAMRIQKVWRGYIARRATRRRKLQEMLLIGMIPHTKTDSEDIAREMDIRDKRRVLQEIRQIEYETAVKECREHLEKHQRGIILEQLSDQVRSWMSEYFAQTGKIPEYTGGSERTSSRLMLSRQGTDSELSKSTTQGSSKDSKSKKTKTTKGKDDKATGEEDDETVSKATVSTFLPEMTVRKEEYDEMWRNKDESINPHQYHYIDIIENEQMSELENELRKIVDDMMRAELQLLQEAFDRDRGFKGKRQKASKKTRKGGKKSKKKKEKDLTPDRTLDSLFEELVANGIIKKYPEVYLDNFKGERSYNPPAIYNIGNERNVSLGDVRQILTEYCILPLVSNQIRMQTEHIKSLLIAGYHGSGKDMLVHAICNEAGAVLFDLTPANIVGKYPGKSGLIMLIHLVLKVGRLLQPSVIYMDNAERPFVKKIPKTDKSDPKRLKKDLPKIVKSKVSTI